MRKRLADVDFLCGVDPVFVGLHRHVAAKDGRPYAKTAHCCYGFQQCVPRDRARTTIVLPTLNAFTLPTICHELGHVLHERLRFEPATVAITKYAERDKYESFAEAFTSWRWPGYAGRDLRSVDPRINELFEQLAA